MAVLPVKVKFCLAEATTYLVSEIDTEVVTASASSMLRSELKDMKLGPRQGPLQGWSRHNLVHCNFQAQGNGNKASCLGVI